MSNARDQKTAYRHRRAIPEASLATYPVSGDAWQTLAKSTDDLARFGQVIVPTTYPNIRHEPAGLGALRLDFEYCVRSSGIPTVRHWFLDVVHENRVVTPDPDGDIIEFEDGEQVTLEIGFNGGPTETTAPTKSSLEPPAHHIAVREEVAAFNDAQQQISVYVRVPNLSAFSRPNPSGSGTQTVFPGVRIRQIACYEVPRIKPLVRDDDSTPQVGGEEYGSDCRFFRYGQPIVANDFDPIMVGLAGQHFGRKSLFQWSVPRPFIDVTRYAATNAGGVTPLFPPLPIVHRKIDVGQTVAQVQVCALAWLTGAGSGSIQATSSVAGGFGFAAVTSTTPTWVSFPLEVAVTDMTSADGLGLAWESVSLSFGVTGVAIHVASVAILETGEPHTASARVTP